jgi:hypothetical protein
MDYLSMMFAAGGGGGWLNAALLISLFGQHWPIRIAYVV